MEEEVHDQNGDKHSTEYTVTFLETQEKRQHQNEEDETTDPSSFNELLDIPTFRNILDIEFFYSCTIFSFEILDVAIGRTR